MREKEIVIKREISEQSNREVAVVMIGLSEMRNLIIMRFFFMLMKGALNFCMERRFMVVRNCVMSKNNAPCKEKWVNEYFGQLLQIKKFILLFITI